MQNVIAVLGIATLTMMFMQSAISGSVAAAPKAHAVVKKGG